MRACSAMKIRIKHRRSAVATVDERAHAHAPTRPRKSSPVVPLAFALALTTALVGATPTHAAPIKVPYTKFQLKNGLTVVLHEDHAVPRVHFTMRMKVGSARETPGRTGFAHLFEHLMFEGSKHVPEGKFDEWLEA